jgi:6-pyruvoyl-tetrahydropterin synthase
MFAVEVRDHIMIAHSFRGEVFGPAQRMHGATYVVDVAFFRDALDPDGIVVDIGLAHEVLKETLAPLAFQNLDELPMFEGVNTTTEYLAGWVRERFVDAVKAGRLGPHAGGLTRVRVTFGESHVARAWAEGPID